MEENGRVKGREEAEISMVGSDYRAKKCAAYEWRFVKQISSE